MRRPGGSEDNLEASAEALQRRFVDLWETLHLEETLRDERDPGATIVPSEGGVEALDFSLITLPNLTGGAGSSSTPAQLSLGPTIGQGGMAIVHLAKQLALRRDVAVKALREDVKSPEATRVLLSEAWVTGLLEHPNIVPVYELGRDASGSPLLVMKCIGGTSWRDFLRHPERYAERFGELTPLEWHLGILLQVSNAVSFAHNKGIVHRDLKPDNVMIGEFGEVYLLDWGLAVSVSDPTGMFRSASSVAAIAGTPGYMAPEMVDWERREISTWTDVYLLGAVLHEILTGAPRHTGSTVFEVVFSAFRSAPFEYGDTVPAELAAIANRATHADPRSRFPSVTAFERAIQSFLRHRESTELADEAFVRLAELQRSIASARATPGELAVDVYRAFGAARFGFEQALRVWGENDRAKAGRSAAIRTVVEHELSRGAHEAAALWLAELPEPDPELSRRVELLRRSQEAKDAHVQALERLAKDVDVGVGARARVHLVSLLAVIWGLMPIATGWAVRTQLLEVTYPTYIGQTATFGAILLAGFAAWRRALLANEVNRRIIAFALFVFTAVLAHRVLSFVLDVPLPDALTAELHLYFLALGVMAITVDRRLGWASVAYLASAFGAAAFREHFYEWHGAGNFAALGSIAVVWRQRERGGPAEAGAHG